MLWLHKAKIQIEYKHMADYKLIFLYYSIQSAQQFDNKNYLTDHTCSTNIYVPLNLDKFQKCTEPSWKLWNTKHIFEIPFVCMLRSTIYLIEYIRLCANLNRIGSIALEIFHLNKDIVIKAFNIRINNSNITYIYIYLLQWKPIKIFRVILIGFFYFRFVLLCLFV